MEKTIKVKTNYINKCLHLMIENIMLLNLLIFFKIN